MVLKIILLCNVFIGCVVGDDGVCVFSSDWICLVVIVVCW